MPTSVLADRVRAFSCWAASLHRVDLDGPNPVCPVPRTGLDRGGNDRTDPRTDAVASVGGLTGLIGVPDYRAAKASIWTCVGSRRIDRHRGRFTFSFGRFVKRDNHRIQRRLRFYLLSLFHGRPLDLRTMRGHEAPFVRRIWHGPMRLAEAICTRLPRFRFIAETADSLAPISFGIWFDQQIRGINRGPYWPLHPTSRVTGWRNVLCGVGVAPGYMPGVIFRPCPRSVLGT